MPSSEMPASILILTESADRPFGSPEVLAELFRAEGVNDLETARLEGLAAKMIEGRSLIVVGPADPSPEAVDLLLSHASSGGGLICLSPGEAFAAKLGLKPTFTGVMHGRIRPFVEGFPETGLPIRGWAHRYTPEASAEALSPLLDREGRPTGAPGILELRHGRGRVAVLAYDAALCVYLLRQGDPLLAGCRASGFSRMRPSDMFEGWQDEVDAAVPVADLHCRLLRELAHRVWPEDGTVLPWLWYYPGDADTVLVLTSDDDWSKRDQFDALIEACEAHDARLTFYIVQERSVMERAWMEGLIRRGFDFSIHPVLEPPTYPLWEARLAAHVRQFEEAYGRPPSPSVRNHAIMWAGYVTGARVEARLGFTFDTNCFSLMPQGRYYMAGGGVPMPFSDLSGETLPVFQLPTQFSDETTLGAHAWSLGLTPEEGVSLVTDLMRRNAAGTHSMLCVNAHPVSFATYSAPLWTPVMAFAKQAGIPVCDVDRFSRFWHARREVRLRPIPKGQDVVHVPTPAAGQSAMIPVEKPTPGARTRTLGGRMFRVCPL